MTVIKRQQQNFNYPNPNSGTTSDAESLHLGSASASDTESVNNEPDATPRPRPNRPANTLLNNLDELIKIKRNLGRKKLRRYQNSCILQTLSEEEEQDGHLVVIMEPYKSPLTRLLENQTALDYWNDFIGKSEEEQNKIMDVFADETTCEKCSARKEKPFARISSKIRRTIKIKKNLSLDFVKSYEEDVIAFFKATPREIYIKNPSTSFDRLLIHAIAQYHCLHSESILRGEKRLVEIYNVQENWLPAECNLVDCIAQLRR